ncbi:hypothetical protein [Ornithinimicrobium kibberense]|uniref:hypothetical protein n=1 Tax=Ornithinimicrobium kibberense TaxID=282060 RepID=UPI003622505C
MSRFGAVGQSGDRRDLRRAHRRRLRRPCLRGCGGRGRLPRRPWTRSSCCRCKRAGGHDAQDAKPQRAPRPFAAV